MKVFRFGLLALGLVLTAACQSLWNVTVYNNSSDPIGVRLIVDGETQSWLFGGDQEDALAQARSPRQATLELFDPQTCEILARKEVPDGPGVTVILRKDLSGNGRWHIDVGNTAAYEQQVILPNFGGCQ